VADADGEVRRRASAAAYAVASRMDRLHDLRRELLDLLERTAGEARADVVEALGRLEGADVERTLLAALEDEAPGVRAAAVRALARPAAAEALLARMAVEQDPRVRSELAGAVGSLKEPRAERALLGWLGDANRDVRAAAADALRRITGRAHDVDHDDCAECRRAEAEERR
jgi:HEAT repeat protein